MDRTHIPDKLKRFFSDMIWSVSGLVIMNLAAQFMVYPAWNKKLGSEAYGNIVYLLAVMNTIAVSFGVSINYARMRSSVSGETRNQPYLGFLVYGTGLTAVCLTFIQGLGYLHLRNAEFILFCLLTIATMWRYYADIEYRLHINYRGYFFYYFAIGVGYLLGIGLFRMTGLWPLALLPGEAAGLLLVLWKGNVLRWEANRAQDEWKTIFNLMLILVGSNLVSQLIFNGDRILIRFLVGAGPVAVYYVASLFGKTMALITTPLNGVLIGYISKYDGGLTRRMMNMITGLSALGIALATAACTAASYIFVPLFYPVEFEKAKALFLIANLAQILYFAGNVLIYSILLRFTKAKNQITINAVYGVVFCGLCCPLASAQGVSGFCFGLLLVNAFRLVVCLLLGYRGIWRKE